MLKVATAAIVASEATSASEATALWCYRSFIIIIIIIIIIYARHPSAFWHVC